MIAILLIGALMGLMARQTGDAEMETNDAYAEVSEN